MAKNWNALIQIENSIYERWEQLFKCKTLQKYYEGFQWNIGNSGYSPYTLNLIFSTIQIKQANILIQKPQFIVEPVPGGMDWNPEVAILSAHIKEAALNRQINKKAAHFADNLKLAALDSWFRFGAIEVGYADDLRNPGKIPFIKTEDENNKKIDRGLRETERLFFKHIRADRWRVSTSDSPFLDHCSWAGYWTWHYRSNLEKEKGIKLPSELETKFYSHDYAEIAKMSGHKFGSQEFKSIMSRGEICKVWHIWDNYQQEQLLVLDGYNGEPIWSEKADRIPVQTLKWYDRAPSTDDAESTGWYPIPPVFQWLSPQDEVNRAREQMRNYRRRFTRKFGYVGNLETEEIDKFQSNADGVLIKMQRPDQIFSIGNPEIGISIQQGYEVSLNDLNIITGTPATARAQADRQTATATKSADMKEEIRESVEQADFNAFASNCGREALLVMKERFTEGMWIQATKDPGEDFLGEVQELGQGYQWIHAQQIDDGFDDEVTLDIINAIPARMQAEKMKFIEFLTVVRANPEISMNPILVLETAFRIGYKNMRVIRQMQKMAQLTLMGQVANAQQMFGGPGGGPMRTPISQGMGVNAQPNPMDEIALQLQGQVQ